MLPLHYTPINKNIAQKIKLSENIMKILIYGHTTEEIIETVKNAGFEIVESNPEMIAVVGGDGTLMKAENKYPEVPKFILKKSKTSKKGHLLTPEEILQKIKNSEYKIY